MQVVYRRCCGIDVHKDSLTASILVFYEDGERENRTQQLKFGVMADRLARFFTLMNALKEFVG